MRILQKYSEGRRRVTIYESKLDGARFYYEGNALYTEIDQDGKNRLKYIAGMSVLLTGRQDVLMLGTAGGALATKISRRGGHVTAVDNWDRAFDVARRWFYLPEDVECIHADGLDFLRASTRQWDGVAIDVFRRGAIPPAMLTDEIGRLLAKALRPDGVAVWNVADHPLSTPAKRILASLGRADFEVSSVLVRDASGDNTLIVACRPPSGD